MDIKDVNETVTKNIKQIREKRNLTLDAAAELTGVSRSMLAQIEKGGVNPTILILWKISAGYKVPFNQLIYHTPPQSTLITEGNTEPAKNVDKNFKTYLVFPFDDKTRFETTRTVMVPGGVHNSTSHMAGTEEYITLFSGRLEIIIGQDVFVLNVGDSIRFAADVNHSYKNIGDSTLAFHTVIFYS